MKLVKTDAPVVSSSKVDQADIHLSNARAVADLVQSLAEHNILDDLTPYTMVNAMDSIRHHIEAARELVHGFYDQVNGKKAAT